jgi:hypothetical protein
MVASSNHLRRRLIEHTVNSGTGHFKVFNSRASHRYALSETLTSRSST